jgi:hypothetical protein
VFSCATIAAVASELGLELRYIEAMNCHGAYHYNLYN